MPRDGARAGIRCVLAAAAGMNAPRRSGKYGVIAETSSPDRVIRREEVLVDKPSRVRMSGPLEPCRHGSTTELRRHGGSKFTVRAARSQPSSCPKAAGAYIAMSCLRSWWSSFESWQVSSLTPRSRGSCGARNC